MKKIYIETKNENNKEIKNKTKIWEFEKEISFLILLFILLLNKLCGSLK